MLVVPSRKQVGIFLPCHNSVNNKVGDVSQDGVLGAHLWEQVPRELRLPGDLGACGVRWILRRRAGGAMALQAPLCYVQTLWWEIRIEALPAGCAERVTDGRLNKSLAFKVKRDDKHVTAPAD